MLHSPRDRQQRDAAHDDFGHAQIPSKQIDVELGGAVDEPGDELTHVNRRVICFSAPAKIHPGIEVSTDQHDASLSLEH